MAISGGKGRGRESERGAERRLAMNSIVGDRYIAELVQIFDQQGEKTEREEESGKEGEREMNREGGEEGCR